MKLYKPRVRHSKTELRFWKKVRTDLDRIRQLVDRKIATLPAK